jgi:hypothetical protein
MLECNFDKKETVSLPRAAIAFRWNILAVSPLE